MQLPFALSCLVCIVHELPRFCTAWQTITVRKGGLQNIQCDNLQIPRLPFRLTDLNLTSQVDPGSAQSCSTVLGLQQLASCCLMCAALQQGWAGGRLWGQGG